MAADPARSVAPRWAPAFNRLINNRVQGLWAPYLKPYAVIVHRGRRSGREFHSPVLAFTGGGKLAVILFYSANAQWVKNVQAAGGAEAIRGGHRFALTNPRVVLDIESEPLPRFARRFASSIPLLVLDLA